MHFESENSFFSLVRSINSVCFEIGNLLVLSFGTTNGWATINFNDLQSANSTFTTGPLNLEEASLVVSLVNIGGFIGNFAILPISQIVGAKRTLHILGLPLIVRCLNQFLIVILTIFFLKLFEFDNFI